MIGFLLEFRTPVHLSVNRTPATRNIFSWSLQIPFNESLLYIEPLKTTILCLFWKLAPFVCWINPHCSSLSCLSFFFCHVVLRGVCACAWGFCRCGLSVAVGGAKEWNVVVHWEGIEHGRVSGMHASLQKVWSSADAFSKFLSTRDHHPIHSPDIQIIPGLRSLLLSVFK